MSEVHGGYTARAQERTHVLNYLLRLKKPTHIFRLRWKSLIRSFVVQSQSRLNVVSHFASL